jgi:hypothetical protein
MKAKATPEFVQDLLGRITPDKFYELYELEMPMQMGFIKDYFTHYIIDNSGCRLHIKNDKYI